MPVTSSVVFSTCCMAAAWLQPCRTWNAVPMWTRSATAPAVNAHRAGRPSRRGSPGRSHSAAVHAMRLSQAVVRRTKSPGDIGVFSSIVSGPVAAVVGSLLLAAVSTLGDFVWARFIPAHRAVFGLSHGALLCLTIGLFLGLQRGRAVRGAIGGVAVGLASAAAYYALALVIGYWAMFVCWMGLWVGFAFLDARGPRSSASDRETLARGLLAAVGSGLAFYAISGIWLRPSPGGPSYPYHFLCWTVAFLPAFLALLTRPRGSA